VRPRAYGSGQMKADDPFPRLMRLSGSLQAALPTEVKDTDAQGLAESYVRLRAACRQVSTDLGVSEQEFDAQFPEDAGSPMTEYAGIQQQMRHAKHNEAVARSAATLLRQLAGSISGLLELEAINQDISQEQLEAAREAGRRQVGFG
jgi:hypothetical protein